MATLTDPRRFTFRFLTLWLLLGVSLVLSGCAINRPDDPTLNEHQKIAMLTKAISGLGPNVDPQEAAAVAAISIRHANTLRERYGVTDAPLIHNSKVNMGLRLRGLCYHWADDIEARLAQEKFQTLDLHRAIANATNLRIEHSTVIVSVTGQSMFDGVVLDGWRNGGELFWAPTRQDAKYRWEAREEVFARKRRKLRRQ